MGFMGSDSLPGGRLLEYVTRINVTLLGLGVPLDTVSVDSTADAAVLGQPRRKRRALKYVPPGGELTDRQIGFTAPRDVDMCEFPETETHQLLARNKMELEQLLRERVAQGELWR